MAQPKGVLIERLQQDGKQPRFTTETRGPDHAPEFHSEVSVDGKVLGRGQGGTKRTAERRAADEALAGLDAEAKDGTKDTVKAAEGSPSRRAKTKKSTPAKRAKNGKAANAETTSAESRTTPQPETAPAKEVTTEPSDDMPPFDGPWPVFETLLASSLQIAHQRTSVELRGDDAREAVQAFALRLYKDLLLDLGDVVDDEPARDG